MEPEHADGRARREQLVMRRLSGELDDGAHQRADVRERDGSRRRARQGSSPLSAPR